MPDADEVKMEIGFAGGGGVHVISDNAQWEQLQAALDGDKPGWVTITAKDETRYLLSIDKVVYVRVAAMSRNIGFSHG